MKQKFLTQLGLVSALAGLVFTGTTSQAQMPALDLQLSPSGIQTNGDAAATAINNWGTYWITAQDPPAASFSISYDPTMRSQPSIPGSIFCVCDWTGTAGDDINVGATLPNGDSTWLGNPAIKSIDATKYAFLMLDIYWTNVSGMTTWGSIGLAKPDYGMVSLTNNLPIPTTPGWQHLVIPIDPSKDGLSTITGISIYRWAQPGAPSHAEFWVDNVQLIARSVPVPPPTVALQPAVPGFKMFATQTPNYNRASLRTGTNANNNVTWVGRPGPVTYAMTVAENPGAAHPYFPLHITIAPGVEPSSDPDWSAADCVFLEIINNGDGSAVGNLHYKTNQPGNNAMLFAAGNLGGVTSPTPLGTWSLTFNQDTQMTVTAPNGATFQAVLPPEVAARFAGPVSAYFGCQMGTDANLGLAVTLSRIQISGVLNPIDEHFTSGVLDPNIWSVHAQSGSSLANVLVPTDAKYWIHWNLPANGFNVQSRAALNDTKGWDEPTLSPVVPDGSQVWALIRQANLPTPNGGFFCLAKSLPTQLQVLLPGETNAPGTLTGKIGTPDPQVPGGSFTVTVNAVDKKWRIVTSQTDLVHLSTSDPAVTSDYLPADASMVSGTVSFPYFYFLSYGTWTVTATDLTTNALAPGTSSPITLAP